jgi:hypothetical protein
MSTIETLRLDDPRRTLLLAAGVLLGLTVALATAFLPWEDAALALGIGLAAVVGIAQTCSA